MAPIFFVEKLKIKNFSFSDYRNCMLDSKIPQNFTLIRINGQYSLATLQKGTKKRRVLALTKTLLGKKVAMTYSPTT